ncbi:hypothetical protein MN608_05021 [Microdochium nivale]|nr:hypothetical protein MN608_05021 [Microdochium nivale]
MVLEQPETDGSSHVHTRALPDIDIQKSTTSKGSGALGEDSGAGGLRASTHPMSILDRLDQHDREEACFHAHPLLIKAHPHPKEIVVLKGDEPPPSGCYLSA